MSLVLAARTTESDGLEIMKLNKRIREYPVPVSSAISNAMMEGDDVGQGTHEYARTMAEFMPNFYKLVSALLLLIYPFFFPRLYSY